jgi:hypothetical protein
MLTDIHGIFYPVATENILLHIEITYCILLDHHGIKIKTNNKRTTENIKSPGDLLLNYQFIIKEMSG